MNFLQAQLPPPKYLSSSTVLPIFFKTLALTPPLSSSQGKFFLHAIGPPPMEFPQQAANLALSSLKWALLNSKISAVPIRLSSTCTGFHSLPTARADAHVSAWKSSLSSCSRGYYQLSFYLRPRVEHWKTFPTRNRKGSWKKTFRRGAVSLRDNFGITSSLGDQKFEKWSSVYIFSMFNVRLPIMFPFLLSGLRHTGLGFNIYIPLQVILQVPWTSFVSAVDVTQNVLSLSTLLALHIVTGSGFEQDKNKTVLSMLSLQ